MQTGPSRAKSKWLITGGSFINGSLYGRSGPPLTRPRVNGPARSLFFFQVQAYDYDF